MGFVRAGIIVVIAAIVFSLAGRASAAVIFGMSGLSGPGLDVRAIETTTGATTPLGHMPNITGNSSEYAFDRNAGRYYLIGFTSSSSDKRLLTIRASNGTLLTDPVLAYSDTFHLAVRNDNVLFGLSGRGANPGFDVRTINPNTDRKSVV